MTLRAASLIASLTIATLLLPERGEAQSSASAARAASRSAARSASARARSSRVRRRTSMAWWENGSGGASAGGAESGSGSMTSGASRTRMNTSASRNSARRRARSRMSEDPAGGAPEGTGEGTPASPTLSAMGNLQRLVASTTMTSSRMRARQNAEADPGGQTRADAIRNAPSSTRSPSMSSMSSMSRRAWYLDSQRGSRRPTGEAGSSEGPGSGMGMWAERSEVTGGSTRARRLDNPWRARPRINRPHPRQALRLREIRRMLMEAGEIPEGLAYRAADEVQLGMPSPANRRNHNDYLLVRNDHIISYNRDRRVLNWASWVVSETDTSPDYFRNDAFRADPTLPRDWYRPAPSDYRNTGFDRGHMVASGSRLGGEREQSKTFVMSNIMPQARNNNRGPWAAFETFYRGLSQSGHDVHIVGGTGFDPAERARVVGNGVAVPDFTWKVAVVLRRGQSLSDIGPDTPVYAISVPNNNRTVRMNHPFERYLTTPGEIERSTGYQLFSNLPQGVADALRGARAPETPPGS